MIRPSADRGDILPYDFRKPSRISPDRQRSLEASHEQLAQGVQRWLSGRLRAPFEVHLESVGQAVYRDFLDAFEGNAATFVYDIAEPAGLSMAVSLDAIIAFLLVERLVGGGQVSEPLDRPLTPLEQVIIRLATDKIAAEVALVWSDHIDLELDFARYESARELIDMTGRDEDVLVATLRVEFEEVKGIIHVALPFPVLEPFISPTEATPRLSAPNTSPAERAVERHRIEGLVRRASIGVSARLPQLRMTLGELAALEPGDFLTTTASTADPVEVLVSGVPRFQGRQGRLGPRMGVQITESIQKE
ncbi:MAG: flagellar motor switch protein FliM [Gemmatimonadetes bacterium]|nr:FliM/FliN family flagellar motor switch protein [Gemmatimonadota bacterium]NNF12941.1 flagellar motor switch protein FliM [Gemmatimonadota bacterium]